MSKKHTETIDSKLKTAWQIVSRMYNLEAARHKATIAIGHFLLNVDSIEGSYASDIAPRLGTESTSLSRIIDSLEREKLITRKVDKEDRRRIKIMLTAKGKQKKELAKTYVRDFNQRVEERIGKVRIEEFFKTVNEIIELAETKSRELKNI
ncbi:MAG: MarR family transcriptional regulator [Bacteroidetes bacterium]|jgi:DNA-binding MarR family transcriptional regulator|nr:MarR family transcriptional regulator [Bacteroidota bacterium]